MAKFNIGDKVKCIFLSGSKHGTVVAIEKTYYVVEFENERNGKYTYSYQEHELIPVETFLVKCDCGAQYTSFPKCHAHWCARAIIDN